MSHLLALRALTDNVQPTAKPSWLYGDDAERKQRGKAARAVITTTPIGISTNRPYP